MPVSPVDVFGEPKLGVSSEQTYQLFEQFSPSRGIIPVFGKREVVTVDGLHYLYMLKLECNASNFLDSRQYDLHKKIIVKVGYSNDPSRRCEEHNSALPPASLIKYRLLLKSKAYPDGQSAKEAEDSLKATLASRCRSLGNEFFLGNEEELQATFGIVPGAGFRILGATNKARS